MAVLIVLFASLLVYRAAGVLGVEWLDNWQAAARCALATMLFFTASAHFTRMRDDLVRMIPPSFPWPRALVFFTLGHVNQPIQFGARYCFAVLVEPAQDRGDVSCLKDTLKVPIAKSLSSKVRR